MDQIKKVVPGKVEQEKGNRKKFKIFKDKNHESDISIEVLGEGEYLVEKLSVEGLPETMNDGKKIRWFTNFSVKKGNAYINEKFYVSIPDGGASRLVIYDGNGNPYYYTGEIKNNTFVLTDGDPAAGWVP